MSTECNVCKLNVLVSQKRIKCIKCQALYHFDCIVPSGSKSPVARGQWMCPRCKSNTLPSLELNTTSKTSDTTAETTSELLPAIKKEVHEILSQTVSVELKKIREDLSFLQDIKASIDYLSDKFDKVQQEMKQVKIEISKLKEENNNLKCEVCSLQKRVSASENQVEELHAQFNRQQQQGRINNVEIVGMPQSSNESPVDIVLKIAKYAGVELTEDSIEFAHRVQPQHTIDGRPKPIVVKLKDRMCKDKLLSGLKRKRGISTSDVGIPGVAKKFFVNEHLTSDNKQLLKATKSYAKERGYKFVWVRNCNIFLRRNEESPAAIIRMNKDLAKMK